MTRRHHRSLRSKHGMTLLEVMFAMFILVMVFGAAISSVVHVGSTVAAAKNRTRAVAILNMQMEEMRSMSFSRLQSRLADASFATGSVADPALKGSSARAYRWTRTAQANAEDASDALVKVVVAVEWDDAKGTRSISSYSYFSKDGVLTAESTS